MMRSMLLLTATILFSMALTGCSQKVCTEPVYPKLDAVDKIPHYDFYVINGMLDHNSTIQAFKTIKALRVSEHYYYTLISDYREDFVK